MCLFIQQHGIHCSLVTGLTGWLTDGQTYICISPSYNQIHNKLSTNLLPLFHGLLYVFFVLFAFSPGRWEEEKRLKEWGNNNSIYLYQNEKERMKRSKEMRQTGRQTNRWTERQTEMDKWKNSQSDRQTARHRQTDRLMYASMRQAITHHLNQWKGSRMSNLWSSSLFEWWRARTFNSSLFWLSWLFFKSFICLKDTRACISGKNIWWGNLCSSNTCNCQSRVYAVIFWSNLCITVKRIHMIKATKSYFPCKSANNFIFSSCDSCINLSSSSCFWNNLAKQTSEWGCSKLY